MLHVCADARAVSVLTSTGSWVTSPFEVLHRLGVCGVFALCLLWDVEVRAPAAAALTRLLCEWEGAGGAPPGT